MPIRTRFDDGSKAMEKSAPRTFVLDGDDEVDALVEFDGMAAGSN